MKKIILSILLIGTIFIINSTITFAEEHPEYSSPKKNSCSKIASKNSPTLDYKIGFTINEEHPDY